MKWRVFFLFLGMHGFVSAQQLRFTTYDVNNGLPQSMVTATLRDKAGYLWVGTAGGLARYDGYSFFIYKFRQGLPNSLQNNFIRSIFESGNGNLVLQTDGGIEYFERSTGRFRMLFSLERMQEEHVSPLLLACNDSFAYSLCRKRIIMKLSIRDGRATYFASDKLGIPKLFQLIDGGGIIDNKLYFLQPDGLFSFDLQKEQTARVVHLNLKLLRINLLVRDNRLFWYDGEQFNEYDPERKRLKIHAEKQGPWKSRKPNNFYIACSTDGKWWVSSSMNGLASWDASGKLEYYVHDPTISSSLPTNIVKNLTTDDEGNLWVGTDGRGLAKTNSYQNRFAFYPLQTVVGAYTGIMVKSILELPDGTILIGSYDKGIFQVNRTTNSVSQCPLPANLGHNCIYTMALHPSGKVLCGIDSGLAWYNPAKASISLSKKTGLVRHIRREEYGYVLAQTNRLLIMDNNLKPIGESKLPESNSGLFSMLDPSGHEWVGSEFQGLFMQDAAKRNGMINIKGLRSNAVRHIMTDKRGYIWAATELGVARIKVKSYHPFKAEIKTFTEADGLANDFVYATLEAPNGHLWISTNKGLSEFDPATETFTNYDVNDGLQSNEFNTGAYFQNAKGELFFGGVNGLNVFSYLQPPQINYTGRIAFNSLSTTKQSWDNISPLQNIELPPGENAFRVDFSALSLAAPQHVNYFYKIKETDADWKSLGTHHSLRFSGLEPGKYTLLVASALSENGKRGKVSSLSISLLPYWYQRWWVQVIIVLVSLLLAGYALYHFTTRNLRKRLAEIERLRQLEKLRSRISSDIHDDIGSGLSKMALVSELAKSQVGNPEETAKKLESLSQNSRQLMRSLREIVWAMNPQHDNLLGMLAYFREYISEYLEAAGIDYEISFDDSHNRSIGPDLKRNLFLILKEALHNAVKYSDTPKIAVTFSITTDRKFAFTISDFGKGIEPEKMRQFGNGLQTMKARAEAIEGVFELYSIPGKGTRITVDGKL